MPPPRAAKAGTDRHGRPLRERFARTRERLQWRGIGGLLDLVA